MTTTFAPLIPAPSHNQTAQQLCIFLEQEGFKVELDADGDLVFRCEGLVYLLCLDEHDPQWGRLMVPFVWEIASEQEQVDVARAMDFVNRRSKLVKAYSIHERVHLSVQLVLELPSSWHVAVLRCIRALAEARTMLINAIRLPELVSLDLAKLAAAPPMPAEDDRQASIDRPSPAATTH